MLLRMIAIRAEKTDNQKELLARRLLSNRTYRSLSTCPNEHSHSVMGLAIACKGEERGVDA